MDKLDLDVLEDTLKILRAAGATHFACPAYSVTLGPAPYEEDDKMSLKEAVAEAKKPVAPGVYGHPSLWPNGAPARFPGSDA